MEGDLLEAIETLFQRKGVLDSVGQREVSGWTDDGPGVGQGDADFAVDGKEEKGVEAFSRGDLPWRAIAPVLAGDDLDLVMGKEFAKRMAVRCAQPAFQGIDGLWH